MLTKKSGKIMHSEFLEQYENGGDDVIARISDGRRNVAAPLRTRDEEAFSRMASCKLTKEEEMQNCILKRKSYGYYIFQLRKTLVCGHRGTCNHH